MEKNSSDQDCTAFVANLFRKKTLVDVQNFRSKLCKDAEKQREELRLIVGERYQELISAADTFKSMRESSAKTLEGISKCKDLCSRIITEQSNPLSTTSSVIGSRFDEQPIVCLSAVRWLTETIPQVWQCIQSKNLPLAVKKYLQCCEILNDDVFRNVRAENVRSVTKKLWATVEAIPDVLVSKVDVILEESDLEPKIATDCLFVLLVLRKFSLKDALSKFLQVRSSSYRKLCSQTITFSAFKNVLSEWEVFVISTFLCVETIFGKIDTASSAFIQTIDSIANISEIPLLVDRCIPDQVKNLKVPLDLKVDITQEEVQVSIESWVSQVRSLVAGVLEPFFRNVSSIRSCAQLRQLAFQKLSVSESGQSRFWDEYMWPVVRSRVDDLLAKGMQEALDSCLTSLKSELALTVVSSNEYSEWIWSESAENAHQVAVLSHTNDLALKSRGIFTNVRTAYQCLDEKLGKVLNDVEYYSKQVESSEREHRELKSRVGSNAYLIVEKLLEESNTFEHIQFGKLLFSIAELKGNLHTALSYCDSHLWSDLKSKLNTAYEHQLNLWIDRIAAQLKKDLSSNLTKLIESGPCGLSLRWENVELDGTPARVPCEISLPFQTALFSVEEEIYSVGGHTLGRNAVSKLTTKLGCAIISAFEECISDQKVSQNLALQFYFDVQFAVALLLRRENKELQTGASNLLKTLESRIDPVDLGMLSSHWQTQVTSAVNSQKLLYHCITPFEKAGIQKFKMNPATSGNHLRIATAPTCPRFTSLRVTRVEKTVVDGGQAEKKIDPINAVLVSKAKHEQSPSSVSTRSFLGAMSSSWFGAAK